MELPILILKIGIALTFILTGYLILKDEDKWVHMLPTWFKKKIPSSRSFMITTAIGDILIGFWLLSGFYSWLSALVASIHLFGVLVVSGKEEFHEVYRDIGLLFGCIALLIYYI